MSLGYLNFAARNPANDIKNTDSCQQCVTLAAAWRMGDANVASEPRLTRQQLLSLADSSFLSRT